MSDMSPLIERASRAELLCFARRVPWYHSIDLGEFVTDGTFDLRPVLPRYGFPEDLRGWRALDIGRASGFFSFELERRGAEVTATELPEANSGKDFVGGTLVGDMVGRWVERTYAENIDLVRNHGDFHIARRLLGSKVRPVAAHLSDLSDTGGPFDLVFVGSVLNHVRDPAGALQQVFAVTRPGGLAIIATPVSDDESETPLLRLVGLDSPSLTTWFLPNRAALLHLIRAAGFTEVRMHDPALELVTKSGGKILHAVVHALRGSDEETRRIFGAIMEPKFPGISRSDR